MIALAEFFLLIQRYGLLGLLFASIAGSTIFLPFPVEVFLPLVASARIGLLEIILTASIGSVIGTLINYGVGFMGIKIAYRKNLRQELKKSKRFVEKHGYIGLFVLLILPLPLPVDPLTVLAGVWRMDLRRFTLVVFTAKILKYSFTLRFFDFMVKWMGFL
ncbi:MAG: hypothetical protein GF334_12025 [Candidatus Altiarchaeales archaeon]|nr:hypothetical protein [Candidatus Altiarchaeales archaeon]